MVHRKRECWSTSCTRSATRDSTTVSAPLRVGVIGCGSISTAVHLRALRQLRGVRVTALADPSAEARVRAGRLVPTAVLLPDAADLPARDDVDAVVIAAPTGLHAPLALTTLRARRHIYLEKPIATTLEDGRRLTVAANEAGVVAAIGYNWRFQPLVARARELLRARVIGDVRHVSTVFCEPAKQLGWRGRRSEGGGVLLDLGSHHFDLIRWLLAATVERVEASVDSHVSEHDSAFVRLHLDGGRVASSFFSFRAGQADSFELIGERGVIRIDRYARALSVRGSHARTTTIAAMTWRVRSVLRPRSEPSWRSALRAFVAKIRGADVELPTFDDGLRSLEVVIAAERAAGVG